MPIAHCPPAKPLSNLACPAVLPHKECAGSISPHAPEISLGPVQSRPHRFVWRRSVRDGKCDLRGEVLR